MKDLTIVVPSYYGSAEGTDKAAGKVIFDHPTPLDEPGTLGRLLESLDIFGELDAQVVIISVANEPTIADEVEKKVLRIIEPFQNRYDIINMSQNSLEQIKKKLTAKGLHPAALELVNLTNYAAVRNMCSLAGILNSSRYTIFIDDDEVFADPDFFNKIDQDMNSDINGQKIQALAGYYLQPDTYRLNETKVPQWRAPYWNNTVVMNEAFDLIIGRGDRLKPTPFVFGGNMTLTLEALMKVPFDPRITRGEDIDFLLNLRIHGITFYLDRELAITHLPPASPQPAWKKLREDALRFLYERKKVRDHAELKLQDLQPYPGTFLGDDLEDRINQTAELLKHQYQTQTDDQGARQCEEIIALVKENQPNRFDTKAWLREITANWQELTAQALGLGIPKQV
ncbi:MAG: hypothetical protein KAR11_09285 [Phycisphaerae bacterium]|nr:hypothetical protein [Phycisphaerae bacterium]